MRNKPSGIYSFTNKTTGKRYIGQTVYLNGRKGDHLLNLRRNQHDNDYLQKAFNKYGEEDFIFEVLEVVPKLEDGTNDKFKLTEREQYWMDFYKSYEEDFGYNINPSASINYMSGRTHTPEARKKISEAATGRSPSQDVRNKIAETIRNVPKAKINMEFKEAKHTAKKTGVMPYEYHVKTPEGVEHVFTNLLEFCNLNNLSQSHLRSMINKGTFYKGWTGYKVDLSKAIENTNLIVSKDALRGNRFEYYLIDRDNKEFVFRSLSVFASDNNISSSTLSKLLKGEIEYRGWKLTRKDLKT
jgi:group I intron endonuclease